MTLRLIRAYRGYAAGDRVDVPQQLGDRLVQNGIAELVQPELFPPSRPAAERAVAGTAHEIRTTGGHR